jgi:hypothetical protein
MVDNNNRDGSPLVRGMMKVNIDAAMPKNSTRATLAAVVRDASGTFLGASVEVVKAYLTPRRRRC